MTIPTLSEPEAPAPDEQPGAPSPERAESLPARVIRALLTQRIVLLAVLVVLVVIYFMIFPSQFLPALQWLARLLQ